MNIYRKKNWIWNYNEKSFVNSSVNWKPVCQGFWGIPGGTVVKNTPAMHETQV